MPTDETHELEPAYRMALIIIKATVVLSLMPPSYLSVRNPPPHGLVTFFWLRTAAALGVLYINLRAVLTTRASSWRSATILYPVAILSTAFALLVLRGISGWVGEYPRLFGL